MAETKFMLNTGATIPAIGFGTWQDEQARDHVRTAIEVGYRHIDTARVYETEKAVGEAIRQAGVPRDQLFITTKLWNHQHHPDDVPRALEQSLDDLGLDYVDLYLMHYPMAWKRGDELIPRGEDGMPIMIDVDFVETYHAMEELLKTTKVKAIGVSNFSKAEMERLLENVSVIPAVHQMEMHPWLQQKAFAQWHHDRGIHITQYSPFGNLNEFYKARDIGRLIDEPILVELGNKLGKTSAQVALAWGITQGHSVLPKSSSARHIRSNVDGDFKLSPEDMRKIEPLGKMELRFNDSSADFGYNLFADLEGKQKGQKRA